jgi:putative ABC transport system permease protein
MGLRPIFSSLLRNSAGALLVAIQIALTLAIVVNAVFVTSERLTKMGRPSGLDDQNQFALSVTGFEKNFDFFAMVRADMAMLRDMPGVIDATPINQIPLSGGGSSTAFYSLPDEKGENTRLRTTTPMITR